VAYRLKNFIKNSLRRLLIGLPVAILMLIALLPAVIGCGGDSGGSTTPASTIAPVSTTDTNAVTPALYRFAVCGDNRMEGIANGVLPRIIDSAKTNGAAFIVDTGDISGDGSSEELTSYRDLTDSSGIKFYAVPGNHDVGSGGESWAYENIIGATYYGFDYHGDHFIIINNADDQIGIDDTQMQWIEADLAANAGKPRQFIFAHIPIADPSLPSGHVTGEEGGAGLRSGQQLVEQAHSYANVSDFFFGHIHAYLPYKLDGINAYVTGGAGAPLYLPEGLGGYYHYLLVSVRQDGVDVQVVRVDRG